MDVATVVNRLPGCRLQTGVTGQAHSFRFTLVTPIVLGMQCEGNPMLAWLSFQIWTLRATETGSSGRRKLRPWFEIVIGW
jgi:hypothetical protein